jgi:acyl-CoA synthetase (AMP-forming)/AMP-acid ligase II/thioesterase domain-containing protein/acyl carrier protein
VSGAGFVAAVHGHVVRHPQRLATRLLDGALAVQEALTFAELDEQARRVAGWIVATVQPDARILLVHPPGPAFLAAFLGCLYAGRIAVPVPVPAGHRDNARIESILGDTFPAAVLTAGAAIAALHRVPALTRLPMLASDDLAGLSAASPDTVPEPERIAFLQYTSGSTGTPRGVMIRHGNLTANLDAIVRRVDATEHDIHLAWVPHFHDLGLITGLCGPLYTGAQSIILPPALVAQRPLLWPEAVGRFGATMSGGPPSVFDLCRHAAGGHPRGDLRSWRVAFVGAEPIRPAVLDGFAAAFASWGFDRAAFRNGYGLAEATLLLTMNPAGATECVTVSPEALAAGRLVPAATGAGGTGLACCGTPLDGTRLVIANPDSGARCAPGEIGEIWAAGPSIAAGYWGAADESTTRFGAAVTDDPGPFLRTGDLGGVLDGNLIVSGRCKDLIIVGGQNLYPQDIEATADTHPAFARGRAAAFAIDAPEGERLVVLVEAGRAATARKAAKEDGAAILAALRTAVADACGVMPWDALILPPLALPFTSSGKIRRAAARDLYLEDGFDPLARLRAPSSAGARETVASSPLAVIAEHLGVPATALDPAQSARAHGLDSLGATRLTLELEGRCGLTVPLARLLGDEPLAAVLAAGLPAEAADSACLVTLARAQTADPPVFAIHAVLGHVAIYAALARALAEAGVAIHGIQARGLLDEAPPLASIAEMAEHYAGLLQARWPGGPHRLLGYSLGGYLAFETAQALRRAGEPVAFLAILDVPVQALALQRQESGWSDEEWIADLGRILGLTSGRGAPWSADELRALSPGERWDYCLARVADLAAVGRNPTALLRGMFQVYRANILALPHYAPERWPDRLLVLRSTQNNPQVLGRYAGFWARPDLGWGDLAARVSTADIAANHLTLLHPPQAELVAATLLANGLAAPCRPDAGRS